MLAAIAALLVVLLVAASLVEYQFIARAGPNEKKDLLFDVRPGESFRTVVAHLELQGVISNAKMFELYGRISGLGSKVRVGQYAIAQHASPKDVMAAIVSGRSVEYGFTVQEGSNIFEIADQLERQGFGRRAEFLALVRSRTVAKELLGEDRPSLEGYLFPETYNLTKFTSTKTLVKMMVQRFKENFAALEKMGPLPMSRNEVVTLASIIEKETGAPEERPLIASVFFNRMRKGMRLETDPTVIYGIWEKSGEWSGNISKADLLTPTRYNTYTFSGLPYGPISNPGFESLKAVLAPATSDYLFFVSRNDGTHRFSSDYAGHLKAVAEFQLDRKAREGKSWRDLKKRTQIPASGLPTSRAH